ncbi:MAG: VWA domain-containing protein [Phycisphaerales bacterium]
MITFNQPWWLYLLLPPALALVVLIGRKTLSGMGTWSRRAALIVRLLVVTLIILAIADPHWARTAKNVAVTVVMDVSRSTPQGVQTQMQEYLATAAERAKPLDQVGLVTAGKDSYVQFLPGTLKDRLDVKTQVATDGTNLEAAARLAMAVMPQEVANRILLRSDGLENEGHVLAVAKAAKAAGIPIDVWPVRFAYKNEVILDRLIAPATARQGENINLRAVLTATAPTQGRLSITLNGEAIDLDPDSPALGALIALEAGTNVHTLPITIPGSGPQRFEAVFEPLPDIRGQVGDVLAENNRALSVTFVGGEGKVLVLSAKPTDTEHLMRVLAESRIRADLKDPAQGFAGLNELTSYECVLLVNTSQYEFSQQQQEELRAYVHDLGGGLVMVGGPDSFGAGGWIGSPLADALPIKLDPPQKRQMPRGALALIMHACEMPEGNYWSRRTATAAVDALSAQDLAGLIESGWQTGTAAWTHPLQVVGDKSAIHQSIKSMNFGDAQSFADMLALALRDLQKATAGQKHCILISDGDPQPPSQALVQQFIASKITISTVAVFPHSWGSGSTDLSNMKLMARLTGGNYHEVTTNNALNTLPQIFIKEAQTVRRSLIWEGDPFSPKMVGGFTDTLRGINGVPPITGYVVAGEREGLAQVTLRGMENDPVMAQWQYGLGRAVTFTSDATTRWAGAWTSGSQFKQFWEQTIRWAMRPTGSPNIRVTTEDMGASTRIVVEALDDGGDRLNFLRWNARMVRPDLSAESINLQQEGPGRYTATVDSSNAGSYTLSMGYDQPTAEGATRRGAVQVAITRPFADEFRALKDNASLLEQVAKETGGQVLTGDSDKDDPWTREGLTRPVSLTSIWLFTSLLAMGFFLADVAVRRVRIDIPLLIATLKGLMGKSRSAATQQIDALKEAREKARQRMASASQTRDGPREDQTTPLAAPTPTSAAAKFTATAAEIRAAKGRGISTPIGGQTAAPVVVKGKPTDAANPDEQGMSRLLKAKKRAQEDMDE